MWFNQEVEHCKLYSDFFCVCKQKNTKKGDFFATLQLKYSTSSFCGDGNLLQLICYMSSCKLQCNSSSCKFCCTFQYKRLNKLEQLPYNSIIYGSYFCWSSSWENICKVLKGSNFSEVTQLWRERYHRGFTVVV